LFYYCVSLKLTVNYRHIYLGKTVSQKLPAILFNNALKLLVGLFFCLIPLLSLAQTDQTVAAGATVPIIVFPAKGCVYDWSSSNASIGIAASGTGNIPSFTAVNSSSTPVKATITATPRALNYVYVTNTSSNSVSVINTATNSVNNTITNNIGVDPDGIGITPDGSRLYIANGMSGTVSFSSTAANNPAIGAITAFNTGGTMGFSADGNKIYVASYNTNKVLVINAVPLAITSQISVGTGPSAVVTSPDGASLYVANASSGNVSVVNTSTNTVTTTIATGIGLPGTASYIAISPDGSRLYVSNRNTNLIYVVNTSNNTVITTINTGSVPAGLAVSPDGTKLYIANSTNNTVSVVNTTTQAVLTTIPVGSSPNSVLLSVDGGTLYVVNGFSNNVSVINTANNTVTARVGVGQSPDAIAGIVNSNCNSAPITFTVTVNPVGSPVITASSAPAAVNTVYGTPSASSSFTISGANMSAGITVTAPSYFEVGTDNFNFSNSITVGSSGNVASQTIYIRLKATAPAGAQAGYIALASTGATQVNLPMPPSTVTPCPISISVYGSHVYGYTLPSAATLTAAAGFDFSLDNAELKNGETMSSLQITCGAGAEATAPVGVYKGSITCFNAQGSNGFLLSNYTITYQNNDITVTPALLTITAYNVTKPYGTVLVNGSVSSGFVVTDLQNGETITSVTMTYGNGAAANAPSGTYTNAAMPSNAVGANGFVQTNYTFSYFPGNIIVGPEGPSIAASGSPSPLTTVYGTPSQPASFSVSGINTTGPILVTPPAGFEESLDNTNFAGSVSAGTSGNIGSLLVYIRLKATTFVGSYTGNIVLTSPGAAGVNVVMPTSTVTPAPLSVTANSVTKPYGTAITGASGSTAYTLSGLQNGETAGTVTINYGQGASAAANGGKYPGTVTASALIGGTFTATNYNIAYQAGDLTVTPVALTITADDKTRVYGTPNPAFTATYKGFLNGDGPSQLTTLPVIYTQASQLSPPGQYQIEVSGAASPNYTFNYIAGTLTVIAAGLPITIPNTFTPNGDGVNDTWDIINLNSYASSHIEIFNRYGTRLYTSNGYPLPWDGRFKGQDLPGGTYYYVISLGDGKKPLSGYVAIIR